MIIDKNLKKHTCFQLIDECIEFYKDLSHSTLGFLTYYELGVIYNLDSDIFLSINNSLKSIKQILSSGQVNDAYALIRKFYDVIIINTYEIIILKDEMNSKKFNIERVNRWFSGDEKLPRFGEMNKVINNNVDLGNINKMFKKDDRYPQIRDRCNDHTHYNFFQYMQQNIEIVVSNPELILNRIRDDLQDLVILHFGYLFTLNAYYMSASEYIDSLDFNREPPKGSQYWVARFAQDFFNKIVKTRRPDIADIIINESYMNLE